jgi:hypothetical protein
VYFGAKIYVCWNTELCTLTDDGRFGGNKTGIILNFKCVYWQFLLGNGEIRSVAQVTKLGFKYLGE